MHSIILLPNFKSFFLYPRAMRWILLCLREIINIYIQIFIKRLFYNSTVQEHWLWSNDHQIWYLIFNENNWSSSFSFHLIIFLLYTGKLISLFFKIKNKKKNSFCFSTNRVEEITLFSSCEVNTSRISFLNEYKSQNNNHTKSWKKEKKRKR